MTGTGRRCVRPASMQASSRTGESREGTMVSAASNRRGATSPSAVSSSDDEGKYSTLSFRLFIPPEHMVAPSLLIVMLLVVCIHATFIGSHGL
jgi:hypothetical protein